MTAFAAACLSNHVVCYQGPVVHSILSYADRARDVAHRIWNGPRECVSMTHGIGDSLVTTRCYHTEILVAAALRCVYEVAKTMESTLSEAVSGDNRTISAVSSSKEAPR